MNYYLQQLFLFFPLFKICIDFFVLNCVLQDADWGEGVGIGCIGNASEKRARPSSIASELFRPLRHIYLDRPVALAARNIVRFFVCCCFWGGSDLLACWYMHARSYLVLLSYAIYTRQRSMLARFSRHRWIDKGVRTWRTQRNEFSSRGFHHRACLGPSPIPAGGSIYPTE